MSCVSNPPKELITFKRKQERRMGVVVVVIEGSGSLEEERKS